MSAAMIRDLYAYHRWATNRLYDHVAALGEDATTREVGRQFSFPTLKGMFGHLLAADWIWLERCSKGVSPPRLPDDAEYATLAAVKRRWSAVETEQKAFVDRLSDADLARVVKYRSTFYPGRDLETPLGTLLQHVANHATHHRSEIATMATMIGGAPPDTGVMTWSLVSSGQVAP